MPQARAIPLHVVEGPERTPTEKLLLEIVPTLIDAEATVARLRDIMDGQRIALAKERGVAFIRPEQVRQEFLG